MISFIVSIIVLVCAYFVYGRIVEKVFSPDNRMTPAIALSDGVEYSHARMEGVHDSIP